MDEQIKSLLEITKDLLEILVLILTARQLKGKKKRRKKQVQAGGNSRPLLGLLLYHIHEENESQNTSHSACCSCHPKHSGRGLCKSVRSGLDQIRSSHRLSDSQFPKGEILMNNPFEGLLSFKEATDLWGLNESTLRKAVSYGKLKENIDVKKFGKQWIVTQQAMEREYGQPPNHKRK